MNPITKLKEYRVNIVDIGASGGIHERWEMIGLIDWKIGVEM